MTKIKIYLSNLAKYTEGNERAKSIKPKRIRTGNGEIEWTLSFKGAVYGYTAIHKKEEGK